MSDERRTPAETSRRFAEAINAGDVESALACWSALGVIALPDGDEVRGRAELAERFEALISAAAQIEIAVSDEVCTELGATAVTRMKMTVAEDDARVVEVAGLVTYIPGPEGLQILILIDRVSPPPG